MLPAERNVSGTFAMRASQPPAAEMQKRGARMRMPMVFTTNCTMSVMVTDHMPPTMVYTMTMPPPSTMDSVAFSPSTPLMMVPMEMTCTTLSVSVYTSVSTELKMRAVGP